MIRKIIKIDEEKCSGCGACAAACHEGAIQMVDGKAKLTREDYCDGLGNCLPACPADAISFEEREAPAYNEVAAHTASWIRQWPVQIKLAPVKAPYFDGADLLIAADCTAFAYGNFHRRLLRGHVVLIGCPKLDEGDYAEKLSQIISCNDIQGVITVARMEVPCCKGLEKAVQRAIQASGKSLPVRVAIISTGGELVYGP